MIPGVAHRRHFRQLSEQEVLALAISSEEDDARIYATYAERAQEYARLYQFLMRQGFTPGGVAAALRRFRSGRDVDQE